MEKRKNKKDNKRISIFDLNYNVIEDLNEITTATTFQGDNILRNLKNEASYKDDSEVLFQSSTFKINKNNPNAFKIRNSALLPEQNKLISRFFFYKLFLPAFRNPEKIMTLLRIVKKERKIKIQQ